MVDYFDIENRIELFKKDLAELTDSIVFQKNIAFGESYVLSPEQYFQLKYEVSMQFGVHPTQVILVGSAKLGFSIAPNKQYIHFNDESDIDVAIVSEDLFDRLWVAAFEYWDSKNYWKDGDKFMEYLFRGWLRPDLLPPDVRTSLQWFEYFSQLSASGKFGPFKISAGVYKSWWFLDRYQQRAIANCRQS